MNWYKRQLKIAMPPAKNFTQDELDIMKEFLQGGSSIREVADLMGVNWGVIKRINEQSQWTDQEEEKKKKYQRIINLYRKSPYGEGKPAQKIRNEYGIHPGTIQRALEFFGFANEWRGREDSWDQQRRDNMSNYSKERWNDPDFQDYMKELMNDPEYAKSNSEKNKKTWHEKYPGGWQQFLSQYPPEKQREIERAMFTNNPV